MKTVQECLVLVILFFVVYSYPDLRCPYPSERRYRSKWFCDGMFTEKYACLYNSIQKKLEESCKFKPVISGEGKEYQISVLPEPISCQNPQRYQPFPLGSNISSECVLLKTTCSDDGQYLFYHGSSTNDHRCGCDFTKGFSFVHKVERQCYCNPSKEDCSCYRKNCFSGYKLSSDYTCIHEDNKTYISKCPGIGSDRTRNDTQHFRLHPKIKTGYNGARMSQMVATMVAASLTLICFICVISGFFAFLLTNKIPKCLIQEISPPYNLKARQEGCFLKLAWSQYEKNPSNQIQKYKLYYTYKDNRDNHQYEWVVTNELHYCLFTLLPSTTYRFKVAAFLNDLVESEYSEEVIFFTGYPLPPQQVTASSINDGVMVSWTDPPSTLFNTKEYILEFSRNNWISKEEIRVSADTKKMFIPNVLPLTTIYAKVYTCICQAIRSSPSVVVITAVEASYSHIKETDCQPKNLPKIESVPELYLDLAKEDCETGSYSRIRKKEFQPMYRSGIEPVLGSYSEVVNVLTEDDCETASFSQIGEEFQTVPLPEKALVLQIEDTMCKQDFSNRIHAMSRSSSLSQLHLSILEDNDIEKDWFYKLNITCDNYSLHLINDFNIPRKFKALSKTVQSKAQTNLTTEYSTKKESTTAFERIYQQTICSSNNILPMSDCIKQNLDLAVRFLLARHIGPTELIEFLYESLQENRNAISKAIGWTITRQFYKDIPTKVVNSFIDIWPGFRCQCERHCRKDSSRICSTEPVIIVEVDLFSNSIPDAFYEIPIQQSYPELKREHKKVQCHEEKTDVSSLLDITIQTPVSISGEIAEILFKQHSKMTMIHVHPSRRRSIQLWAQIKGVIPIGENHFPKTINGLDTCIAEGHVRFMAKIQIGDTISVPGSAGTLGGFVQMHGCNAFLTCAHVVHDKDKLIAGNKRELHRSKTKVFCLDKNNPNSNIESGYVVNEAFDFNNAEGTSVDAAVVILDEDKVKFDEKDILSKGSSGPISTDFLGMNGPYLNDNYITPKTERGTVAAKYVGITSGYVESNVTFEDYDRNDEKFKTDQHGLCLYFKDLSEHAKDIENECPRPADTHFEVHFQQCVVSKLQEVITSGKHYFRCYKQLLFTDFLFKPGDSGTCIYVVEDKSVVRSDNHPNPTGCLAMAIASFYDRNEGKDKCIATPMQAILKKLGLI